MNILAVCLGNICRSPLAEGILRSKLDNTHHIDSAGTGNWHVGESPDKRSVSIAKKYGIDIQNQQARQFKKEDFTNFDIIFVMDSSNYQDVISLTKNDEQKNKVKLILENADVPDPYYGGDAGFDHVFQLLDKATDKWINKLELK